MFPGHSAQIWAIYYQMKAEEEIKCFIHEKPQLLCIVY